MRRKTLWMSLALVVFIAGTVLTVLYMLTQHEPAFYRRAEVPSGPQRIDVSGLFMRRGNNLVDSIRVGGEKNGEWGSCFSAEEVNSFFAEDFVSMGFNRLLPDGISDPRIAFEQDSVRLAFRYGSPPWSTIVSIDFRVWLAQGEPNVVVLELQGLHAGSLPIPAQSLLEDISELLGRHNIQVTWYRHEGNPTAALKIQSDQARPTCQLRQLHLKPGMLSIAGHSSDPLQDYQKFGPIGARRMPALDTPPR